MRLYLIVTGYSVWFSSYGWGEWWGRSSRIVFAVHGQYSPILSVELLVQCAAPYTLLIRILATYRQTNSLCANAGYSSRCILLTTLSSVRLYFISESIYFDEHLCCCNADNTVARASLDDMYSILLMTEDYQTDLSTGCVAWTVPYLFSDVCLIYKNSLCIIFGHRFEPQ